MTDFAKEVQERFAESEEADRANREEAILDLEFAAGEQWNKTVRELRENRPVPLPCLTINTMPQYIGQVIGDRRANATSIKVLPREDGDVKIAEVRSELIRSIELQSKADRVYSSSFEQAVTCGIGNFRVDLDYAYEDAFDRDLFIRAIPNPLAVRWDPLAADPTGRDAAYCFVPDEMTKAEYKRRFPKATEPTMFDDAAKTGGWVGENTVRCGEYHTIIEKERTIALMADGSVKDVTGMKDNDWKPNLYRGATGQDEPRVRTAKRKYARMVFTNGMEELAEATELPIHRLPIIRVLGREVWIENRRVRFGLVRFARDPQRLKNYWRSVVAEKLMLAPRHNYIADARSIAGREKDWPNTLVFDGEDGAPPPVEMTQSNLAALLNEAQMCAQDMKDVTGLHDASLGMSGNETSGVAIQRRQNEGDIATIIYHDNMNGAMQEAGEVLNTLLDTVYDTSRTIRTVGADMSVKMVRINDPSHNESINLATGKYDVTISTGPAYATRRQEASASMMEAAHVAPQMWQVAGDLMAKAQDWPNADEIAERIKRTIPPQILGDDKEDGKSPEEIAKQQEAAAQAQQMQQLQEQIQVAAAQADLRLKNAQADKAEGEALKAKAEVMQGPQAAPQVDPMMAMEELRLKAALADQAEANAAEAQANAMVAAASLNGSGDPEAMQRLQIEAFNAITKRIIAVKPLTANEPSAIQGEAA